MRIIPQEELDAAEVFPMRVEWRRKGASKCCIAFLSEVTGCSADNCVIAQEAGGRGWQWHGTRGESPSPETIWDEDTYNIISLGDCPKCVNTWFVDSQFHAYRQAVHNRAATIQQALGEFDEEAERARLMPV